MKTPLASPTVVLYALDFGLTSKGPRKARPHRRTKAVSFHFAVTGALQDARNRRARGKWAAYWIEASSRPATARR